LIVRCLTCQYSLKGHVGHGVEHRCPECGSAFDPGNPLTFERFHRPTISQALLVFALMFAGLGAVGWWSTRAGEGFNSASERWLYLLKLVFTLSFITAALAWCGWYIQWWWHQSRE
jgi:hypothetical protein